MKNVLIGFLSIIVVAALLAQLIVIFAGIAARVIDRSRKDILLERTRFEYGAFTKSLSDAWRKRSLTGAIKAYSKISFRREPSWI